MLPLSPWRILTRNAAALGSLYVLKTRLENGAAKAPATESTILCIAQRQRLTQLDLALTKSEKIVATTGLMI
jgi:hypothetical protein